MAQHSMTQHSMARHSRAEHYFSPFFSRASGASVFTMILTLILLLGTSQTATAQTWGTYLKPFAVNSFWNSRPVSPTFGSFVIPTAEYLPAIAEGVWSTGVFLSSASDGAVTVKGLPGKPGVWDPDSETFHEVTIPHWPASVVPAAESDGHADIVDPILGIVHSFWQLKHQDGQWIARQYAWTPINGRGWGDPAHYFQGARAAGVATMAGLIRKHEVTDQQNLYRHALAMSLTFNALSANPTYIFPATSADTNAATTNTGQIPEGALLMLPPTFDTQQITNLKLRKVAETLKVYGAYVVDRNHGTPFSIYVENGSGFKLLEGSSDTVTTAELDKIRLALRQVTGVVGWLDGNGTPYYPGKNLNLLSMRGTWQLQSGTTVGVFDTWAQAVVFPTTPNATTQVNYSNRGMSPVSWALPIMGVNYRLTAHTTGGAKLHLQVYDKATSTTVFDSGELADQQAVTFTWKAKNPTLIVRAISGVGQPSSVRGELVRQ